MMMSANCKETLYQAHRTSKHRHFMKLALKKLKMYVYAHLK